MKCKKCGSEDLVVVPSGPHKKLVCVNCLAFQKFLSAKDAETFLAVKEAKALEQRELGKGDPR